MTFTAFSRISAFSRKSTGLGLCLVAAAFALTAPGCLSSKKLFGSQAKVDCLTHATPLGTDRIKLDYVFPPDTVSVVIYRDGVQVAQFEQRGGQTNGIFVDNSLVEGNSYSYTCSAMNKSGGMLSGNQNLLTAPLSLNAPPFAGIASVTPLSPSSVLVSWNMGGEPGKVAVANYRVYASVGSGSNPFMSAPVKTTDDLTLSVVVNGLGDELPYAFGVRACSAAGHCDSNTVTLDSTLSDGGAPATLGVLSATTANGQIILNAPWSASMGAVKYRQIYQSLNGGTSYSLLRTDTVSDLTQVPSTLEIANVLENTTYRYIVKDIDPSGNSNLSLQSVSITTGDLTAPAFNESPLLTNGTPADSVLQGTFTAMASQAPNPSGASDPNGAEVYFIYKASGNDANGNQINPCQNGTLVTSLPAANYNAGATVPFSITGLTPRTSYRVCVKARDRALNTSINTGVGTKNTLDITPPQFEGITGISFSNATTSVTVTYAASPSADVRHYKISLWKNSLDPCGNATLNCVGAGVTVLNAAHPSSSYTFTSSSFLFEDGDEVYAVVNACDNAVPTYSPDGVSDNCTTYGISSARKQAIPNITPPQGFGGILAFNAATDIPLDGGGNPIEGQMIVRWNAPASWVKYSGFQVYSVDTTAGNALTTEGTPCVCVGGNCATDPTPPTSCLVTGLDPYRTYRLHIRAYDSNNNYTTYLDPANSYTDARTADRTPPVFNANLQGSVQTGPLRVALSWNPATDAQTDAPQTITYTVYGRDNTAFTSPTNHATVLTEKNMQLTSTSASANDTSVTMGLTRYYTICASDMSGNMSCSGPQISTTVHDTVPPTLSNFTIARTGSGSGQTWNLGWSMSDNVTPTGNLSVTLKRIVQNSATVPTDWSGAFTVIGGTQGATAQSQAPNSFVDLAQFPAGAWPYVFYQLTIADARGNSASGEVHLRYATSCPTDMVMVPGSLTLGTDDFCVFKYEAKSVVIANGLLTSNGSGFNASVTTNRATSRPDGMPWTSKTLSDYRTLCTNLGEGYRLPNNPEWQTMARDIEKTASNWSGGAVGTGTVNYGNSDSTYQTALYTDPDSGGPKVPLAKDYGYFCALGAADEYLTAAAVDARGNEDNWIATGETSATWASKRTHTFSNGSIIWDLAGNAAEWVDDLFDPATDFDATQQTFSTGGTDITALIGVNRTHFGTEDGTYGSAQGFGKIWTAAYNTWRNGIIRGGDFGEPVRGGVFSAYMGNTNTSAGGTWGFRCVYTAP